MTKQPKRIQVKETERYWGDFEGSLKDIIASLKKLEDDGWEGIEMGRDQWSQDHEVPFLYKHRPETYEEYAERMKELEKEKERKVKAKEKRRQEYERLKKEFENA